MVAVLVAPIVLVVLVAILAFVFVQRSTLRITSAGVEIRNYPQAAKLIPLEQVRAFEPTPRAGNFKSARPNTAVLVLTDGSRLPVRKVAAADAGTGVEALNRRVESLRGGT